MLCIWFYLVLSVLLCLFVSQKGWIMYMLHTTVPSLEEEDCALTSLNGWGHSSDQMRRCRSTWREHLSWWKSIKTIKNRKKNLPPFLVDQIWPNMTKYDQIWPDTTTWYTMTFSNCGMLRCCHLNWSLRQIAQRVPRLSATHDFGQDQPSTWWSSHSRELLAGPDG